VTSPLPPAAPSLDQAPSLLGPAASLPVVETFHSLQGEGLHAGRSAFFIRLAGCEVGCPWCDTKHSWPAGAHGQRSLVELAEAAGQAAAEGAAFAVLTGGEPLHHDLSALCAQIRAATTAPERPLGLPLHLETSGVDPIRGRFDWITLSPKRHRPPRPELLAACDELKLVVHEPADLAFAEAMTEQARQLRPPATPAGTADAAVARLGSTAGPALLLQPGWDCRRGQELAIAFVRSHPAWRLSLQSHKWLGVR
jgi:organic radical activating enzyme